MPKISVIIPIYGVEKYIERCARSLFEQTFDDIEYIFVDDCTPDKSIEILESVLKEYPSRIDQTRIVKMPTNGGLPAVRRHGTQLMRGDYLIHCDSDDWVDTNMLQIMYDAAIEEDADIVVCDFFRSDGVNNQYVSHVIPSKSLMQGPVWNKLVKSSIYKDNDIEFPKANKAEDGAIMAQVSFFSKKAIHVAKPLYYYFINAQSICGQISAEACVSKLKQECENVELRVSFLRKHNAIKQRKTEVIRWKMQARDNLLPVINESEYYKLWKDTYPEINTQIFFSGDIRMIMKYLLIRLRIFSKVAR